MGWLWVENGLPIKRSKKEQREMRQKMALNPEPIHPGHGKTNVAKEMQKSVLKGIERQESVAKVTDKKAAKLRKVIITIVLTGWG